VRALRTVLLSLLLVLVAAPAALAATPVSSSVVRCTIRGTPSDDVLHGTPGRDVICAGAGDDRVFGGGGNDRIFGGAGRDVIRGDAGNDSLDGESGDDVLYGGPGHDSLYGGSQADRLDGAGGGDDLYGGLGADVLDAGGQDADNTDGGPGGDSGEIKWDRDYPDCPRSSEGMCKFSMHIDLPICPPFTWQATTCLGTTPYAPAGWAVRATDPPGVVAEFGWTTSRRRDISYMAGGRSPTGVFYGRQSTTDAARFEIITAWQITDPRKLMTAPDDPSKQPGEPGGPFHLNYESGRTRADVYINGYLGGA
jgi:hypothetical protein